MIRRVKREIFCYFKTSSQLQPTHQEKIREVVRQFNEKAAQNWIKFYFITLDRRWYPLTFSSIINLLRKNRKFAICRENQTVPLMVKIANIGLSILLSQVNLIFFNFLHLRTHVKNYFILRWKSFFVFFLFVKFLISKDSIKKY